MARALLLALTLLGAFGLQRAPVPQFDSAALREWQPGHRPHRYRTDVFRQDPGRVVGEYSPLVALVRYAFHLTPSARIKGLPNWAGPPGGSYPAATMYSLDGRMPASTTDDQARLMVQSLLRDRFQLTWHWTNESIKVFDLVVAPDGPKLKLSDATDPKVPDGTIMSCPSDVTGCTFMGLRAMTMAEFAETLPVRIFGRPVVNKTALAGKFYVPELILLLDNETSATVPSAPNVLRQTCGLELRPATADLPVLVVDHVGKPATEGYN